MSLRRLPRRLAVFALLAFLLSTALPPTVGAAGPGALYRPGGRSGTPSSERFNDLDAAVQAGALDKSVREVLRGRGAVEAMVTFDGDGILARASKQAPEGRGRAQAILGAIRPEFAGQKRAAFRRAGQGLKVLSDYENLAASFVRFHSAGPLLRLLNSTSVTGVRENHRYQATLDESLPLVGRTTETSPAETGLGTEVAVLDTGVNYLLDSTAFGDCSDGPGTGTCKVSYARDFTASDDGLLDDGAPDCGGPGQCHGTNVAAIALGVAPGTRVLALDVFDGPEATDASINAAVNWVVGRRATGNVRAANLSLGSLAWEDHTCWESPMAPGFASLRAVGVVPVVAAGNGAGTYGYTPGIAEPACAPGAMSVGAVYDADVGSDPFNCGDYSTHPDKIACFSQSGTVLSILAPGAMITAAGIAMSGTSQATPHVAGAVAVLAAKHPQASAYQLHTLLATNGVPLVDSRPTIPITTERLDLGLALAAQLPASPLWADPPLRIGSASAPAWTWWSSLSQTASGSTRYLHNTHMNGTTDLPGIQYMRSTNGGAAWTSSKRLNPGSHIGDYAVTASSGSHVYTAWMYWGSASPYYRIAQFRANNLHGAPANWSARISLSAGRGYIDPPSLAASGPNVYVAWTDSLTGNIRFRRSADYGASWGAAVTIGTTSASGDLGRWGTPALAASGAYVSIAWIGDDTGALRQRISASRGNTWSSIQTLDSNANDRPAIAARGSRFVFAWTDPTGMRLRVWNEGAWISPTRTLESFGVGYVHRNGYSPAVAITGTGTIEAVWTACRQRDCAISFQGRDLMWRRSINNAAGWVSPATIIVDSHTAESRRANDGADIEFASASRRHVAWDGYYPDNYYFGVYQLTGG